MFVRLILVSVIMLGVGCSSSSDDPTPIGNSGDNSGGEMNGNGGGNQPTGPIPTPDGTGGVWLGNNGFGDTTFVIDGDQNLFGFSANGSGGYESVFGNIASGVALSRFLHRDSEDQTLGMAFTAVGDVPAEPDNATVTYNFIVENDEQSLVHNSGAAGSFSLMRADSNDLAPITPADVAGDYEGRSALCFGTPIVCSVFVLTVSIDADGTFSGFQNFGDPTELMVITGGTGINGSVASGGQFLSTNFTWATDMPQQRSGVIYRDRTGTGLILNAVGPMPDGELQTFSTQLLPR